MPDSPAALITGAAGFVGQHLARHLLNQGWSVKCSDIQVPADNSQWHVCDMADPDQVNALVKWASDVTHVFHLAAITFIPESGRNPAKTFEINLLGTIHLAHALTNHPFKPRLIFIGSAEAYGHPQSLPITEDHPLNPSNPYAISKAAADQYLRWAHETTGLDVVRLRPFNHSGPGQSDQFVLSAFARQLARIEAGKQDPVVHVGNLDSARDFSHVTDVIRAYELAALKGKSGEDYNICSGKSVRIGDALNIMISLCKCHVDIQTDTDRTRPAEITQSCGSCQKLTRDTGWTPQIPLEQLLHDLLTYWRNENL